MITNNGERAEAVSKQLDEFGTWACCGRPFAGLSTEEKLEVGRDMVSNLGHWFRLNCGTTPEEWEEHVATAIQTFKDEVIEDPDHEPEKV